MSESDVDAEIIDHTDDDAADGVDWAALWDEFGFDTPGPDGKKWVSGTQLKAAVQSTEQDVTGGYETVKDEAVGAGVLHKITIDGHDCGFIFDGGER